MPDHNIRRPVVSGTEGRGAVSMVQTLTLSNASNLCCRLIVQPFAPPREETCEYVLVLVWLVTQAAPTGFLRCDIGGVNLV